MNCLAEMVTYLRKWTSPKKHTIAWLIFETSTQGDLHTLLCEPICWAFLAPQSPTHVLTSMPHF